MKTHKLQCNIIILVYIYTIYIYIYIYLIDIIFNGVLTANLLMDITRYKTEDVINCLVNK